MQPEMPNVWLETLNQWQTQDDGWTTALDRSAEVWPSRASLLGVTMECKSPSFPPSSWRKTSKHTRWLKWELSCELPGQPTLTGTRCVWLSSIIFFSSSSVYFAELFLQCNTLLLHECSSGHNWSVNCVFHPHFVTSVPKLHWRTRANTAWWKPAKRTRRCWNYSLFLEICSSTSRCIIVLWLRGWRRQPLKLLRFLIPGRGGRKTKPESFCQIRRVSVLVSIKKISLELKNTHHW